MTKTRLVGIFIACLILSFGLFGCSNNPSDNEASGNNPERQSKTSLPHTPTATKPPPRKRSLPLE